MSRRIRGWLGSRTWRQARFWSVAELRRLMEHAGLPFLRAETCVYYPPIAALAKALSPFDAHLSSLGQCGAAFLAVKGRKP